MILNVAIRNRFSIYLLILYSFILLIHINSYFSFNNAFYSTKIKKLYFNNNDNIIQDNKIRNPLIQLQRPFVASGDTIWSSRRLIVHSITSNSFIRKMHENQLLLNQNKDSINEKEKDIDTNIDTNKDKENIFITSFIVAISALILRYGGRFAFMQILGLDNLIDNNLKQQLNDFIIYFQSIGELQYILYFFTWFLAKFFLIDFLGIILAFSSGILFHGLLQGTIASVIASTLSCLLIFLLARWKFYEQGQIQIQKRPILRAINTACSQNGFKTVFVLRLSPIIPIPIGAYNYLYGISSLNPFSFIFGTACGCIKPYFLDCYLGLIAQDLLLPINTLERSIESSIFLGLTQSDLFLLGFITIITLVGTYSAQIAEKLWQEIQLEAKKEGNEQEDIINSNQIDIWKLLAINLEKDLPKWLQNIIYDISLASYRINTIIQDESSYCFHIYNQTNENKVIEQIKIIPRLFTLPWNIIDNK